MAIGKRGKGKQPGELRKAFQTYIKVPLRLFLKDTQKSNRNKNWVFFPVRDAKSCKTVASITKQPMVISVAFRRNFLIRHQGPIMSVSQGRTEE